MGQLCAVSFNRYGRLFYFDPGDFSPAVGDLVLVPTDDGPEVGECVWASEWVSEDTSGFPRLLGPAGPEDLRRDELIRKAKAEARVAARKLIRAHELPMKVIAVDYVPARPAGSTPAQPDSSAPTTSAPPAPITSAPITSAPSTSAPSTSAGPAQSTGPTPSTLAAPTPSTAVRSALSRKGSDNGGARATIYFTAPHRVDFRSLVRDLGATLRCRVELRQVSARDSARVQGGVGSCGRDLCCATFLTDFEPVTIRMAKDQELPLNPMRISGACGRLMCCLKYEHPLYVTGSDYPTNGAKVETPDGPGRVVSRHPPSETVGVRLNSGGEVRRCALSDVCGSRRAYDDRDPA